MQHATEPRENEPFFRRDGDTYVPQPICRGPWDPNSLHGRVVAGLLAHAIETRHGNPAYVPARITIDMYRLPDFSPMTFETRVIRDGRRIKVIDAEVFSAGVSVGRASSQLLLRTAAPAGDVWSPANWDAPHPDSVPRPEPQGSFVPMWDMRPVSGAFMSRQAHKRCWMRETRDLVDGVPITPWVRAALAADFASPFANSGTEGLGYINSDITMYLHREPRGEWIGFETMNHQATDGVAVGECFMYDLEGPIGSASVCALGQAKRL
jgi:hypothetical protein